MVNTKSEIRKLLLSELGEEEMKLIDELCENTIEIEFLYPTLGKVFVQGLPPLSERTTIQLNAPLCILGQNGYGKSTLLNSIAFSFCGVQSLRIRGMSLDYFRSREFHRFIRIYSKIHIKGRFIEGSRKISSSSQEFEGVKSDSSPISSITELEKAFVDLCGLRQLTGRQFLDLLANVVDILYFSERRESILAEDAEKDLERLWPLIFNLTYYQDAFLYIEKKIQRIQNKIKETCYNMDKNNIKLKQVKKIIRMTLIHDLSDISAELRTKEIKLSEIREEIQKKEIERKSSLKKLENKLDKTLRNLQEEKERFKSIKVQLEIGTLEKLGKEIRTATHQTWKYCKLCGSRLEDKWKSRIDNSKCPICESPREEFRTDQTFEKISAAMKKGIEDVTFEPTKNELNRCKSFIDELENEKEFLKANLLKLKNDPEIEILKKEEKKIDIEKARLEERKHLVENYEKIMKEKEDLEKIIEKERLHEKQMRELVSSWEKINTKLNQFFSRKAGSAIRKIREGFEYYMGKFEGGESNFTLDSNFKMIYKRNNKQMLFNTLSFGQRNVVDLAVRFAIADAIFEYHGTPPLVLLDMPDCEMDEAFREGLLEIFDDVMKSNRWQLVTTTFDLEIMERFNNNLDLSKKVSFDKKTPRQIKLDEFLGMKSLHY